MPEFSSGHGEPPAMAPPRRGAAFCLDGAGSRHRARIEPHLPVPVTSFHLLPSLPLLPPPPPLPVQVHYNFNTLGENAAQNGFTATSALYPVGS